ncbi:SDR family NAD(P)-dependent oxidoreductase [Stenotrophobium rhamnosiphilum]|uniref:SDR family NAD(P)-dependent oxidoreductase n=1 Tax=Stenotrophobium rhamnosiphilum TaxID=2029166 RepID=UPI001374C26D|nr:SDR family NAD(P)-dependent oxidoreductase [Stenotrophobium rhamnosiphilum]
MTNTLERRTALVTGGAAGLGLATALSLAREGAQVLIVDRNREAGEAAARSIIEAVPQSNARFFALDLGDLDAVKNFADEREQENLVLDLLINNAGLLPPMQRAATSLGHELGFGVSVVGHYVLTGSLLKALNRAQSPRVVTLSSMAHRTAKLPFNDLNQVSGYDPTIAYGVAKLAALMFALELDRRAQLAGNKLLSLAAHPGISKTGIGAGWNHNGPLPLKHRLARLTMRWAINYGGQSIEDGAKPTLMAAIDANASGGLFYGPSGFAEMRGAPRVAKPSKAAQSLPDAARLWAWLESETGMRYLWP